MSTEPAPPSQETTLDGAASTEGDKSQQSRGEYYNEWDKYANAEAKAADEVEKAEEEERRNKRMMENLGSSRASSTGYEFRKGHKIQFPEIVLAETEDDDEAAWRVACERKETGNESFRDGSVWGAQQGIDAWGQGLLALTRIRNLRKGRVKKAADDLKRALKEASGQKVESADLMDFSTAEAWEAMGWTGSVKANQEKEEEAISKDTVVAIGKTVDAVKASQRGPTDEEVLSMVCTLQMNVAQGLLKLGQFENAVGHCDAALQIEPNNVKALWRKAKAVWGTRNPGFAREALDALLKVDPSNAAALTMLREIEVEEAKKKKKRTGMNVKPTFRFPKTVPSSLQQSESPQDGAADEDDTAPTDEDAAADSNIERTQPDVDMREALEEEELAPPKAAGWACCRRKSKLE